MRVPISVEEKYGQPDVIDCWQNLSRAGLQRCEQEMVRRYFPPAGHILDVGCGTGRAVLALSQAGYRVTGIDLSLPMLAGGRSLSAEARLGGANLLALPFVAGVFDSIFMFFGALQHIPKRANRRRAMAEMARVAQADARLIIGLDNLAPALGCYIYWLKEKLLPSPRTPPLAQLRSTTAVDTALWSREPRRVHPLLWHLRGVARTLRWRTWPGLIDLARAFNPVSSEVEPGDIQVAQFSLQSTPGKIYYHVYRPEALIEDAADAGWGLLGHHSGTELNEDRMYPAAIRRLDKQQFFAFERVS